MKIGFITTAIDGNPFRTGLHRGLVQLGHEVVFQARDCDLYLIFNQSMHTPDYAYPQLPYGLEKFAFIDTAEYGPHSRLPEFAWRYWNTFTPEAMCHSTKNPEQQERLKCWIGGRSFPYFIREYTLHAQYPPSYHPIDYPLHDGSECNDLPSLDEYLKRQSDLFLYWGGSHPWREKITDDLRRHPCKSFVGLIDEQVFPRLGQEEHFARTKAAKCSVSFDGYGSSSFRLTEVLVRTHLLMGPLQIKTRQPLIDGIHCRFFDVYPKNDCEVVTTAYETLKAALDDPEGSYTMYEAGYRHCMEYYTEKATAEHVLRVIEGHDWSMTTLI